MNKDLKSCLIILGAHRSGTSAAARVSNLLGVDLGRDLMGPVPGNNPMGFWEHVGVCRIQEALLRDLGYSWHDLRLLPYRWWESESAEQARVGLKELLESDFRESPLWGLKDPRMSRLFRLWPPVLKALACTPRILFIVRNPLEVAASLAQRDGFSLRKSLALWFRHVVEAEYDSRGYERTFVTFEQLLSDWRSVMERTASDLHIEWPQSESSVGDQIDEFIRPSLRHHMASDLRLRTESGTPDEVVSLWEALSAASNGRRQGLRSTFDQCRSRIDSHLRSWWVGALADDLAQRIREAKVDPGEYHRLRGRVEGAEASLSELQEQIASLKGELNRVNAENTGLRDELSLTKTMLAATKRRMGEVLNSGSWRLTAPIRALERLVSGYSARTSRRDCEPGTSQAQDEGARESSVTAEGDLSWRVDR